MKVLTYNLWHGLNGKGITRFGELEPAGRRHRRFYAQLELFAQAKPDLILLQELLPAPRHAQYLAQRLGYQQVHQVDNSGLKLYGFGWPSNLESGLAILWNHSLQLIESRSVRLSGSPLALNHSLLSVHLAEQRYALLSLFNHHQMGRGLVVNLHLHHGFETDEKMLERINEWYKAEKIDSVQQEKLEQRLTAGDQRREKEMSRLEAVLEEYQHDCDWCLIGGDFNSGQDNIPVHRLLDLGFKDVWREAHPDNDESGWTWDPEQNPENHRLTWDGFDIPLKWDDLGLSHEQKQQLTQFLRQQIKEHRRLDYLFFSSKKFDIQQATAELFATKAVNGVIPSDHFGILAEVDPAVPSQ